MPNIPPLITSMPNAQPLYAEYTPLPSGILINATWTTNTPGTNYSTTAITVPGVTATSVISAAIQGGSYADTNNSWLMLAVPSANTITFKCYTQPATPATFAIAWAVAKF
jgi:hypothetical protein